MPVRIWSVIRLKLGENFDYNATDHGPTTTFLTHELIWTMVAVTTCDLDFMRFSCTMRSSTRGRVPAFVSSFSRQGRRSLQEKQSTAVMSSSMNSLILKAKTQSSSMKPFDYFVKQS
jgi:hypothetical protein